MDFMVPHSCTWLVSIDAKKKNRRHWVNLRVKIHRRTLTLPVSSNIQGQTSPDWSACRLDCTTLWDTLCSKDTIIDSLFYQKDYKPKLFILRTSSLSHLYPPSCHVYELQRVIFTHNFAVAHHLNLKRENSAV